MHSSSFSTSSALLFAVLRAFLPLLGLMAAVFAAKALFYGWKLHRIGQSGIEQIDQMTGREFEQYLEALFTKLGYKVERTPYVRDYGADLVVCKEGVKTVVQAKRHKSRVGAKAIGETLRAKGNYRCSSAMLVTNSAFTRQAEEEARNNGIVLWDREELIRQLLSVKEAGKQTDNAAAPSAPPSLYDKPRPLPSKPLTAEPDDVSLLSTGCSAETASGADAAVCIVCGKVVSANVKQYCLDHPHTFGGHIYCFKHQR